MGGSATAKPTASAAKPTATAAPATKAADAGDEAYYRTLAGLNKGFAQWVAVQMASRPDQSWAAGVLDYVAHCDRLGEPSTSGGGGGGGGGGAAARSVVPGREERAALTRNAQRANTAVPTGLRVP